MEEVILRAMSSDPARRFASLESFGRALLPFATEEVRTKWAPAFDVASDPPPPEADPLPSRLSMASADTLDALNLSTPQSGTLSMPPPPQVVGAHRSRNTLIGLSLVLALVLGVWIGATFVADRDAPATSRGGWGGAAAGVKSGGPAAELYQVRVEVTPKTARFIFDGEPVSPAADGTFARRVRRDGRVHTLHISAPGHVSHALTFLDASPVDRVALAPVPVPPLPSPPPAATDAGLADAGGSDGGP